jgi:apolipoprotein N-acyltransferase
MIEMLPGRSKVRADNHMSSCVTRRLIVALAAIIALMAAPAMEAGTSAAAVSFGDLVNHPEKYNGKRVSVRAYLVTSCTHCREFWASVQSARDSRIHERGSQNWITFGDLARGFALPKWLEYKIRNQNYDGYVRVTGTFQYVHMTRETALTGFGWGRLDDKQITEITQLQPLGPPIPAGIN